MSRVIRVPTVDAMAELVCCSPVIALYGVNLPVSSVEKVLHATNTALVPVCALSSTFHSVIISSTLFYS